MLYGQDAGNLAISVREKELEKILSAQGTGALVEVQLGSDKPYAALFREIQRHPVKGSIVHFDLYQVPLTGTIKTTVPLILEGEAKGIKQGGVFQHNIREVEIECIASQIPEGIKVDVSELDVGDMIKIADLTDLAEVKFLADPDAVIAAVLAPQLSEEEETAEDKVERVEVQTETAPEEE